jgi:hypothetical protein
VSSKPALRVPSVSEGPVPAVLLVDARTLGLPDLSALREHARSLSRASDAPFTSRSYCFPFALLAAHASQVGVDIERVSPCDEAFADSIRTPAERAEGWTQADPDRFFTSLWSSKEALSKALGNALAYDPRWLGGPGAWPDGRSGPWRASTLDVGVDHVAWLCWRVERPGGIAPDASG